MLCIETSNVGAYSVEIRPGGVHRMCAIVSEIQLDN
jgi:hypothetical protein